VSELAAFRPEEILRRLVAADVAFVVIGGLAAQAHGSPSLTRDLDICYARDGENLARLAAVLQDIVAVRRSAGRCRAPSLDAPPCRWLSPCDAVRRPDLLADPDPGPTSRRSRPARHDSSLACPCSWPISTI
jgi:hypothetical protein